MKISQLSALSKLDYFNKEALGLLEPRGNTLDGNIKNWIKSGQIIPLKRGMYILRENWERETDKDGYLEFLANKLYEPSYISCEYVMSKYSLLTEAVFSITSITTKKTKSFTNPLGRFSYYSITPDLFTGYRFESFRLIPVAVASKEKAVFDFLYLRFIKNAEINSRAIEELRINWDMITKREFKKIKSFAKSTPSRRIKTLLDQIERAYYAQ